MIDFKFSEGRGIRLMINRDKYFSIQTKESPLERLWLEHLQILQQPQKHIEGQKFDLRTTTKCMKRTFFKLQLLQDF